MDAAGENEEQKKIRNAQLIRDLSGRIPQKCEVFKNMLVYLEAIGFTKTELLECKEEGVREVFNVLEQKGLIELGKYDKLRSILCRLDKKAVGMIDDCVKYIKALDGIVEEKNELKVVDIRKSSSELYDVEKSIVSHGQQANFNGEFNLVNIRRGPSDLSNLSNVKEPCVSRDYVMNDENRNQENSNGAQYLYRLPGFYQTSKERENFARLSWAIFDLCSDVLRQILHRECQPKDLIKRINFDDLFASKLTTQQIELIKNAAKKNSYNGFDISLLYVVIRIIALQNVRKALETDINPNRIYNFTIKCQALVTDPCTKLSSEELRSVQHAGIMGSYDHLNSNLLHKLYMQLCENDSVDIIPTRLRGEPDKHSTKIGDDIERIRHLRNTVVHIPDSKITDGSYKKYCGNLGNIMTRMDATFHSYYKFNLDLILTTQLKSVTQKRELYHPNVSETKEVLEDHQSLEEIRSELRHAIENIGILLLDLKSIKEKIEMEDRTTDTTRFSEHEKIQLELIIKEKIKSEVESQMKIQHVDKEIELEKIKNDWFERKEKATERAKQTEHEMKLELINKETNKSEKECQMRLEILDKEIELEKAKGGKIEKEGSAIERARQSENKNQKLQYKHIVMSERENQMRLELLDKESDRLSQSRSVKEACMFLMGFSVGIIYTMTTASVLLYIYDFHK